MAPLNCIEEKNYGNVSPWQYDLDFFIPPCKTIIKKKTRKEGIEDFKHQTVLLNRHSKTTEGLSRDLTKVAIFVHNFKSMVKEQWSLYL